eukprot:TRINITY_DN11147_c0_g1_i2.p1 TRINITY_DN11147_c0_g1~~TRINITY_DN11147_c0_g1_i2.p1  ORF type:complete len:333 (+),score=50.15 TRINITY_DN11147_c0_g1_i2:38-1036(+)
MAASTQSQREIIQTSDVRKVKHPDGTKTINGFRVFKECIGEGTFAKVKVCELESSADKFALKVFRKLRLRKQRDFVSAGNGKPGMKVKTSLDKVYDEIRIMKTVDHPHCIRLLAILDEPDNSGKLYLVIEYAAQGATMEWDSNQLSYFRPKTKSLLPENVAKSYIHDTLQGLSHLHSCCVAHRDIKPQNLLVNADGVVKVADFGVAIQMDPDCKVTGTEGTYYFFAPEMCRSGYAGHDGRLADVWAAGVSLWAFFYGTLPFYGTDLVKLLDTIAEAKIEQPQHETTCSSTSRLFLEHLLASEVSDRPHCNELLLDPWLQDLQGTKTGLKLPH